MGGGGVACNLVAHFLDVFTLRLNALLTDLQIRGSMSDLILLFFNQNMFRVFNRTISVRWFF